MGEVRRLVNHPVKAFSTVEDQVKLLRSRGLELDDEAQASQWLRSIGYYRLSGYWYPYRQMESAPQGSRKDDFVPGTSFNDVVGLYEFDRKLRTLIHDGIERIEVAMRAQVSAYLGKIGPLAYQDPNNFRPSFDHKRWLDTVNMRVNRARTHSEPVRHHDQKYGGALPIWVLTEVLDFADVSRLFEGLPSAVQWRIAGELGIQIDTFSLSRSQRSRVKKLHPMVRWLEQLTVLRNSAAHHSRLWNRNFVPVSTAALRTVEDLQALPEGESKRVYGALVVMTFLLHRISPGTTWGLKVCDLVEESFQALSFRSPREMGFPEGWRSLPVWHLPNGST